MNPKANFHICGQNNNNNNNNSNNNNNNDYYDYYCCYVLRTVCQRKVKKTTLTYKQQETLNDIFCLKND